MARYAAAVADRRGAAADDDWETWAGGDGGGRGGGGGQTGFAGEDGLAESTEGVRAGVEGVGHYFAGFRLERELRVYIAAECHGLSVSTGE